MAGFLWDDLRKIFTERSQMAKVPHGVETLPKILIAWVGYTNVRQTDGRTDGQTTTYSERKRELTFAKISMRGSNFTPTTPLPLKSWCHDDSTINIVSNIIIIIIVPIIIIKAALINFGIHVGLCVGRDQSCQISTRLAQGFFWSTRWPKIAISHWLEASRWNFKHSRTRATPNGGQQ